MPIRAWGRSIRAQILAIVLVGAIAPLSVVGVWLTASAVRSGRQLLREQLDASADALVSSIRDRWSFRQGELLLLADNIAARRMVEPNAASVEDSSYLAGLYERLSRTITSFTLRDLGGTERWSSSDASARSSAQGGGGGPQRQGASREALTVRMPIQDTDGMMIGQLEARVALDALVSTDSGHAPLSGAVVNVRDGATQELLTRASSLALSRKAGEMHAGGVDWMVVNRTLRSPPLDLRVGAPIAPYVAPFERTGRVGLIAVLVITFLAIIASAFLTHRLTRSLHHLVDATSAVARGDLRRRVDAAGPSEIRALAGAFNSMTDSLERTLGELSRRTALSAVGEFAASFAHEVRNALTSVKVDLQRAEDKLPPSPSRDLVVRTISSVGRLDATVTGALQVARSGRVIARPVDLRAVLEAATGVAASTLGSTNRTIDVGLADEPLWVSGDGSALEQMFINLLINAGQALDSDGRVRVSTRSDNGHLVVSISDTGVGMDAEQVQRALEPFFTTRPQGTGLGLPIARQIAIAHGGEITIESQRDRGTTVSVRLPRASTGLPATARAR